jgi:hypothetical protein
MFCCPVVRRAGSVRPGTNGGPKLRRPVASVIFPALPRRHCSHEAQLEPLVVTYTESTAPAVEDFASTHRTGSVPALLRGYAAHWLARSSWRDPNYLCRSSSGEGLVSVERSDDGVFSHASTYDRTRIPIDLLFDHFAACAGSGASTAQVYAAMVPVDELGAELHHDLEVPKYIVANCAPSAAHKPANIWLGQGAVTPLHFDSTDNFLTQVCGVKYVRLYSPIEGRRLYPFRGGAGPPNASQIVDIDPSSSEVSAELIAVHNARWPGFLDAKYATVKLEPGDMVRIPSHPCRWLVILQGLAVARYDSCSSLRDGGTHAAHIETISRQSVTTTFRSTGSLHSMSYVGGTYCV